MNRLNCERWKDICSREHCSVEKKRPPGDSPTRNPAIKDCEPSNGRHATTWQEQACCDQQRVDHGLVTASPRDRTQSRYLGTDTQIKQLERAVWMHRIEHPAQREHGNPKTDDANGVGLSRPRQRF